MTRRIGSRRLGHGHLRRVRRGGPFLGHAGQQSEDEGSQANPPPSQTLSERRRGARRQTVVHIRSFSPEARSSLSLPRFSVPPRLIPGRASDIKAVSPRLASVVALRWRPSRDSVNLWTPPRLSPLLVICPCPQRITCSSVGVPALAGACCRSPLPARRARFPAVICLRALVLICRRLLVRPRPLATRPRRPSAQASVGP